MPMQGLGKSLVIVGGVLLLLGLFFLLGGRLPGWLGRLPGDIHIQKENVQVYFPLATCVLLSILITFLVWLFGRWR
jgi:hypothetical protein